jgi:hypothetical protein
MGSAEDEAREAKVDLIMKSGQDARDRYFVTALMRIEERCEKQTCSRSLAREWTPTAIGTAITGTAIGILEYLRK